MCITTKLLEHKGKYEQSKSNTIKGEHEAVVSSIR